MYRPFMESRKVQNINPYLRKRKPVFDIDGRGNILIILNIKTA